MPPSEKSTAAPTFISSAAQAIQMLSNGASLWIGPKTAKSSASTSTAPSRPVSSSTAVGINPFSLEALITMPPARSTLSPRSSSDLSKLDGVPKPTPINGLLAKFSIDMVARLPRACSNSSSADSALWPLLTKSPTNAFVCCENPMRPAAVKSTTRTADGETRLAGEISCCPRSIAPNTTASKNPAAPASTPVRAADSSTSPHPTTAIGISRRGLPRPVASRPENHAASTAATGPSICGWRSKPWYPREVRSYPSPVGITSTLPTMMTMASARNHTCQCARRWPVRSKQPKMVKPPTPNAITFRADSCGIALPIMLIGSSSRVIPANRYTTGLWSPRS